MMASIATDTQWLDATDQAKLVRDGSVTPLELLNAALERAATKPCTKSFCLPLNPPEVFFLTFA